MNFAFTEDQLALKEGMASFFAAESADEKVSHPLGKIQAPKQVPARSKGAQ